MIPEVISLYIYRENAAIKIALHDKLDTFFRRFLVSWISSRNYCIVS